MFRRMAALAAGVVLAVAGSVLTPTAALAATSGCGSVCDGKDPATYYATVDGQVMRCSYVNVLTPHTGPSVELRYSPFCRTAWARNTDPGPLGYVTIESWTSSGKRLTYKSSGSWTKMVNDKGMTARACHYSWEDEYDYNAGKPARLDGCTPKY